MAHGRFKRPLKEADVETICRALLAYCLLHYRGDENIKSFIWDLITPSEDGTTKTLTNHSGESRGWRGHRGDAWGLGGWEMFRGAANERRGGLENVVEMQSDDCKHNLLELLPSFCFNARPVVVLMP